MADMLPPNIIITGSFRSGTTLLYLMFPLAFEDVAISGDESDAMDTLLPAGRKWRVSKRPNDIHRVRILTEKLNPYFIYLIRDPRDCIVSWKDLKNDYHLSFNEWLRNLLFAESARSTRLIFIKYEDMILTPSKVQDCLTDRIAGLEKSRDLADCSQLIDPASPITHQLTHDSAPNKTKETIRPLDKSGIGGWVHDKERIHGQLAAFPEMQAVLEKYGYEADDTWQALLKDEGDRE